MHTQVRAAYIAFHHPGSTALRVRPLAGYAWLHEVKFDGYRCQLHKARNDVVIFSKTAETSRTALPGIRDAVLTLPCKSAIIDGEVAACGKDGTPEISGRSIAATIARRSCVWCFDLMALNGEDLRLLPLVTRKQKLCVLLRRLDHPYVRYSEPFKNVEPLLSECHRRGS